MRSIVPAVLVLLILQPAHVPDLVIVNARVFTGVAAQPWAEAIAITGDRIAAVGSSNDVGKLSATSTRRIDAARRLVIPGINDAHLHLGAHPPSTRLEGPPTIAPDPTLDSVLDRLKAAVARSPAGGWIAGEVGATVLDDPRATRILLDTVAPNHPVALRAWTGHGTLLNSRALEELGIREDESDPPGGYFARLGTSNTITGLAHEYADYAISRMLSMKVPQERQVVRFVA